MHVRDPEKVKSFKRKKIGKSSFTHKRALLDPGAKGDSFLGHLESSQRVLTYLVTAGRHFPVPCDTHGIRTSKKAPGCYHTEALGLFASNF